MQSRMTAASPSFAGTWRREREGEQEGRRKNDDDDDDDEEGWRNTTRACVSAEQAVSLYTCM